MLNYPRLRDLREDMDITQEGIAEIINTTQSYYAQYEKGARDVPFGRIIALAKFYGVSIDYIAGLTNDKRGLTRSELSDEETALIKKYRGLSESGKGKIMERMDIISEQEK